jgi:hypothetical protein
VLTDTIKETREILGSEIRDIPAEMWAEQAKRLAMWFTDDVEELVAVAKSIFSEKLFDNSRLETLYSPTPSIQVCSYRIRPNNAYYQSIGAPVPGPDNPSGRDATGIELSFSLLKQVRSDPAQVEIVFRVWGYHERNAFKRFFSNYRRIIELLLAKSKYEFFTAVPFDSLDSIKKNNIIASLESYLPQDDPENSFSIYHSVYEDAKLEHIVSAFIPLLSLYDSSYHYLAKSKNLDKVLSYYLKLR